MDKSREILYKHYPSEDYDNDSLPCCLTKEQLDSELDAIVIARDQHYESLYKEKSSKEQELIFRCNQLHDEVNRLKEQMNRMQISIIPPMASGEMRLMEKIRARAKRFGVTTSYIMQTEGLE
jgi:hypothetical protein